MFENSILTGSAPDGRRTQTRRLLIGITYTRPPIDGYRVALCNGGDIDGLSDYIIIIMRRALSARKWFLANVCTTSLGIIVAGDVCRASAAA